MSNVLDWLRASAEFMAKDRPDVFKSTADALNALISMKEKLDSVEDAAVVSTAGFELNRVFEDEGVVDYRLTRIISSATIFEQEDEVIVAGWTKDSGTLSVGVDLPQLG